jgi:hypothetical protein
MAAAPQADSGLLGDARQVAVEAAATSARKRLDAELELAGADWQLADLEQRCRELERGAKSDGSTGPRTARQMQPPLASTYMRAHGICMHGGLH